ncbi:hypothetical protein C8A01DRAFT_43050 [Parachaetomium inaequale]|uniref:Methyltransferase domain-containing protein n=1 Tax=Parachaetomium inaequale TaxID=2588326 RepID=A0AAN6SUZ9_9PEZI|nr:hypothetical protein C8A01DRAFT_43050 [Parachaetomium inaequale]
MAAAAATRQAEAQKFFSNYKRAGGSEWEHALLDNARRVSEPLATKMLDQMGLTENTNTPFKVLENACGVGVVAPVLQRITKPEVMKQSSILCGDFSEQALGMAKQRIESEGWVNTEARVIDAQKNGLDDGAFTHVATNIGFHVVPDSEAALNEAIRILQPGGILGLTTWHKEVSWITEVREAFKTFPFEASFDLPLQTTTWGDWSDVNWMRKALEGRGLQDVKVEAFAFLSRSDSADYFVSIFGIMMDMIMNSCWSEELRKEHPKEEVLKLLKEALEKKYGGEGARALPTHHYWRESSSPEQEMADLGLPHNHNQLTTILNALASIDRRLSRIETALKIPGFNNANPAVVSGPPSSASLANPATGATTAQAGHLAPAPPPPALPLPAAPPPLPGHHQQPPGILTNHATNPPSLLPPNVNPLTTAFAPLEPPPQGYTISSRAAMQDELDQWTLPRGYSMRIAGAKVTGKRKVRWVCFRGGEARHHRAPVDEAVLRQAKAEGRRKPTTDRASKKCGCLFKFEVIETVKDSDVWVLHYPNEEHKAHNHGPSDTTSDPRARKLPGFMSAEVDRWLREGWLVSKIQEELRGRGFTNVLNTDLYNRKRLLRKEGGPGEEGG